MNITTKFEIGDTVYCIDPLGINGQWVVTMKSEILGFNITYENKHRIDYMIEYEEGAVEYNEGAIFETEKEAQAECHRRNNT